MSDKNYLPRLIDKAIERELSAMGALLIQGPKWCGKTTSAEQHAQSVLYFDDPSNFANNLRAAETNVHLLLDGDTPRLIDEWQFAPKLWDAIRFTVDHRDGLGQFILTGSAVPADQSQIHHSGAGRFAWLTMRPMSLWESGESTGEVSLTDLFAGKQTIGGVNKWKVQDLAHFICRGGWPGALALPSAKSLSVARNYVKAVTESDISRVDGVQRNAKTALKIMQSYARHQGTQATIGTINADIANADNPIVSEKTLARYLQALQDIFVIEDMPAWNPNLRSKTAIRTADTRYFIDPSIAAAALRITPEQLLKDLNTMGLFFETLCIRDLRAFADTLDAQVYHFRDKNGLECDAVIDMENGQYGLVEIKLGGDKYIQEGIHNLTKLASKIDTDRMNKPAFKMVLTGITPFAYYDPDADTYIVPIGCLKP